MASPAARRGLRGGMLWHSGQGPACWSARWRGWLCTARVLTLARANSGSWTKETPEAPQCAQALDA